MSKLKRYGGIIECWELCVWGKRPMSMRVSTTSDDEYDYVVRGRIYGDGHWPDGEFLRTSVVVNITEEYVETLNTIYKLGKKREEL